MPGTLGSIRNPRPSQAGVGIALDTSSFRRLAADLRRGAPLVYRDAHAAFRLALEPIAEDARARSSFSSRIEYTIKIRGSGLSLKIVAGGEQAPDAAPIENRGRGHVRHPTWGHRDRWTDKNSPPAYLTPAFEAGQERFLRECEAALMASVDRVIAGRL